MQKSIAFFDFDGTITRKDTMIELIKFHKGTAGYFTGLALIAPWLVAMKLGIITNQQGKEKLLAHFFKGMTVNEFNKICEAFSQTVIPNLIRSDAWEAIQKHFAEGNEVVVVSASAENWVKPWCKKNNIEVLASILDLQDGKITGKLKGTNCNDEEKVNRILLSYDPAMYKDIYAYGDSSGDKKMLEFATHGYYRMFVK